MSEGKIDRTIMRALDMVEKLEKLFANNGAFEKAVMEVDGDISYFTDVRKRLAQVYQDIEDLHYGAVGHLDHNESVTESKKLTEGVLDDTDDDGFMARSQLYFLAKDAIALHGMIDDRDNLEPWVQSKIATAAEGMDAVRRYTEYNAMKQQAQLPVPVEEPEGPPAPAEMEETVVIEAGRGLNSIEWPDEDMAQHAENAIRHNMHAYDAYSHVYSMTYERDWMQQHKDELIKMFASYGLATESKVAEAKKAKPDYLDLDKDGNRKEPMKKAAKEKDLDEDLKVVAQDMFKSALSAAKKKAH